MTRSRALINIPNRLMASYYQQRSNAGLIISEGTAPSPNGLGYVRIPGIYTSAQIEGWKLVTEAVHKAGGHIFLQLMHCGRIASKLNMPAGADVLAPSAVQAPDVMYTDKAGEVPHDMPVAMTKKDIINTIEEFRQAAINAIDAGFDGVEFHAATGYLPNQFISTNVNQRTDDYGGSIPNRCRFVMECLEAITSAIGNNKVGIKFSPGLIYNDLETADARELFAYLADAMNTFNLAYVHVTRTEEFENSNEGFDTLAFFRKYFKGFLIANHCCPTK